MRHVLSIRSSICLSLLLVAALFETPCNLYAQPATEWQKAFGGTNNDKANAVIQTADLGYIFVGSTMSNDGDPQGLLHSNGASDGDLWVVKLSSAGAIQWQQVYGGFGDDVAHAILQTSDGGYAIAGTTGVPHPGDITNSSFHGGTGDAWILRLNSVGAIIWQKCYGGSLSDGARSIVPNGSGGFVFAGFSQSNDGDVPKNQGGNDLWIANVDANGGLIWSKTYGGSDDDQAQSLVNTSDGGYAVAGYTQSSDGDIGTSFGFDDFWVLKLKSDGTKTWAYDYGGGGDDEAYSIIETADQGFAVAGFSNSGIDQEITQSFGDYDFCLMKLNRNGVLIWQHAYGGTKLDEANSLIQSYDGGFVLAGETNSSDSEVSGFHGSPTTNLTDEWIVKTNDTGKLVWEKTLGGSQSDEAFSIVDTKDSGYAIAGVTKSSDGDITGFHGSAGLDYDVWLVKLKADTTQRASVASIPTPSLLNISLFPNPGSGLGQMEYNLATPQKVTIDVYNQIGQKICVLASGMRFPGKYSQKFDLRSFPSGQYYFHIQAGQDSRVGALGLMR